MRPYGHNDEPELLPIYSANAASEKSVFYFGKYDSWKENKNNHLYNQVYIIPPGTLPIGKGVFFDQTEVANIDYQEFLHHIARDSGKYVDKPYYPKMENKLKTKYFLNPEFYFYPVVGVTHENAEKYCEWRAKKLNEELKSMLMNSVKKYRYKGRLPNEQEWKNVAGSTSFIKDNLYTVGKKEIAFFEEDIVSNRLMSSYKSDDKNYYGYNVNLLVEPPLGIEIEIPLYIYSFERNEKGFYNMYGNVKELVQEGYAIGGSFKTGKSDEELFFQDDIQAYKTDVGFRCMCEIARRR